MLFYGVLVMRFVLTHKISLTHSIIVHSFILSCSWKKNTENSKFCFPILEICPWELSLQISEKYCTILVPFDPFVAICSSVSLQKQRFGSTLELPVKWLLHIQKCPLSSVASFCLLSSALL